jgi:hypothetical protein
MNNYIFYILYFFLYIIKKIYKMQPQQNKLASLFGQMRSNPFRMGSNPSRMGSNPPRMGSNIVANRPQLRSMIGNSSGSIRAPTGQLINQIMNYLMMNGITFPGIIIQGINNVLSGAMAPSVAINNLINYLIANGYSLPYNMLQGIYNILNSWAIYQGQMQQRRVSQTALNNGAANDYYNCVNALQSSGQQSVCSVFNASINVPNDNYIQYFNTHI